MSTNTCDFIKLSREDKIEDMPHLDDVSRRIEDVLRKYFELYKSIYDGLSYQHEVSLWKGRVTHKRAIDFSKLPRLKTDRPLDTKRLINLYFSISSKPMPFYWSYIYVPPKVRSEFHKDELTKHGHAKVDGHTSSSVLALFPALISGHIPLSIAEFTVSSKAEARAIWEGFNTIISTRKPGEFYMAAAAEHPELNLKSCEVSTMISVLASNDPQWGRSKFGFTTPEQRKTLIPKHLDFGEFLTSILDSNSKMRKHLRYEPVMNAIYKTWRIDPEGSEKFWSTVRDRDGCPGFINLYCDELLRMVIGGHNRSSKNHRVNDVKSPEFLEALSLEMWNSWCRGVRKGGKFRKTLPRVKERQILTQNKQELRVPMTPELLTSS